MRLVGTGAFLVGLVCVSVVTIWRLQGEGAAAPDGTPRARAVLDADDPHAPAELAVAGPTGQDAPRRTGVPGAAVPASETPISAGHDARATTAAWSAASEASWPVVLQHSGSKTRAASAETSRSPAVPARIAFRALWYLGTDPEAELTWRRAIDDPAHPPGVRSDLIVDMIDEGYTDNSHPTKADLPVILARLELIERYAPFAMDEVNAEAFEVAYRHLLDMYVRLGGAPRGKR